MSGSAWPPPARSTSPRASLATGPPRAGSAIIAATEPTGRRFAEAEFGAGEGPAHEAWTSRRPVLVPEVGGPHDHTWPGYTHIASTAGICAVFAFPLQVGAIRLGVLTLFHDRPRQLTQSDLRTCLVMAELGTEKLTDHSSAREHEVLDPSLDTAMALRSEVYQAQGMVAVALGITLLDALAMMRSHAFQTGTDLIGLANDIVHHGLQLDREA